MVSIRKAAVAGSWYPATAKQLASMLDEQLAKTDEADELAGDVVALIAPHAGLRYSGPVAAHAYRVLRDRSFDVAILVGPSHFIGFEGVALYGSGGFDTPFGVVRVDEATADRFLVESSVVHADTIAHAREHSLEMQLPFLRYLAPELRIVPLLIGRQTAETAEALASAIVGVTSGTRTLLIASTDLSHYNDAATARRLDEVVIDCVGRFDADGLQRALDRRPEHACGGGAAVAIMRAARGLGATSASVLSYADSGDVSGDKSSVVGYLAAAIGRFHAS
jgi:hypothetical protein